MQKKSYQLSDTLQRELCWKKMQMKKQSLFLCRLKAIFMLINLADSSGGTKMAVSLSMTQV